MKKIIDLTQNAGKLVKDAENLIKDAEIKTTVKQAATILKTSFLAGYNAKKDK